VERKERGDEDERCCAFEEMTNEKHLAREIYEF